MFYVIGFVASKPHMEPFSTYEEAEAYKKGIDAAVEGANIAEWFELMIVDETQKNQLHRCISPIKS